MQSLGLWDLDLSAEREIIESVVEEQKDENKPDSCLSLDSSSPKQEVASGAEGKKKPGGLRKRKVKSKPPQPPEGGNVAIEAQTSLDDSMRKDSDELNEASDTSREIEELTADEDPLVPSAESSGGLRIPAAAPLALES